MVTQSNPIEVLLGRDGSWAVEGVVGGQTSARGILQFLLGSEPSADTYKTNAVWNWLYFPPGSLTGEQRGRILSAGKDTQAPWTCRLHEVEHVDQPGQLNESYFEVLKEPKAGRIVAASITVALLAAAGLFWLSSRQPSAASGSLGDVLAAAATPYEAPTFSDRFAAKFSDGDRFMVPVTARDIVHRGTDVVILSGGGDRAYFIEAEGIGETIAGVLQGGGAALGLDTRGGLGRIASQKMDGAWIPTSILELTKGNVEPGLDPSKVRFDDPSTFTLGARYAFAGGVEVQGDDFVVFALPRTVPPHRVIVRTDDPGLRELLGYVSAHNYTAVVTGALGELEAPESRAATRIIGRVGPAIEVQAFRSSFVPNAKG